VADQARIHPFGYEMIRQLFVGHGIPNPKPSEEFSSFAEAVERFGGRVLLLGDPGSGKTTALMSYARDAVAARIQNATLPLPILGLLSTWDPAKPLSEWLAAGYAGLAATDVARVIELGQALILLDGLDEVRAPKEPSQLRERQIQLLSHLPTTGSIVITSRAQEYREVGVLAPLEGAVTLQPITDIQLRSYLAGVPVLLAAIHANPDLKALVSTPLMLSLIATTCENMNASERSELMTLTIAPGDLRDFIIERYVYTRYEWEERRATRQHRELFFSSQETLTWLGRLAMENAGTYRKKASERDWDRSWDRGSAIDANVLTIEDFQFVLGDSAKAEAFCHFARSLDVIVEQVEGSLSFRHLLVRDALAYPYRLKNLYVQDFYGGLVEVANPAHALAVTGRARAVDTLIKLLTDIDQPSIMRECAADGLGFTRDVRCVDVLLHNLERGEFLFRSGIALGLLGDLRAFDSLISLLEHSGKSGKRGAAHGLGALGDPRAVPFLAAALEGLYDDAFTAQDIIFALVRMGEPGIKVVLQKIREGLNGWESNGISVSGTRVLAERGDRRALELLLSVASDTNPTVRAYAAGCLGWSGFPAEAVPLLQQLLSDSALVPYQERLVSDFAQEALNQLKEIKEH
jgi:HEAT repeat protein